MASDYYAEVAARLYLMAQKGRTASVKYQKLKAEVQQAKAASKMANTASRVHKNGHKNP